MSDYAPGDRVEFRKWYDKRFLKGRVVAVTVDFLLVETLHRAARGGSWVPTNVRVVPGKDSIRRPNK